MTPYLQAGAAGGLGGLLGQLGGAFSAPRRALWSALGGPESGAELVSGWTGLDPGGGLASALGAMAEVAGDPLTLAFAGAPAAMRAVAAPWTQEASALARLRSLGAAEQAGLTALHEGDVLAESLRGAGRIREAQMAGLDLPGIASGATKTYRYGEPGLAGLLQEANLGRAATAAEMRGQAAVRKLFDRAAQAMPADDDAFLAALGQLSPPGAPPGLTVYGRSLPPGAALGRPRLPAATLTQHPGGQNLMPGAYGSMPVASPTRSMPSLAPDELARLQAGQVPANPFDLVLDSNARTLGAAAPAGTTLADLLPRDVLAGLPPGVAHQPLRLALAELGTHGDVAARAMHAARQAQTDYAMAGGAGLGAFLGGQYFGLGE